MAKNGSSTTETIVRDSKSGRFVTVRGAGALRGQLKIKKGLDLTKPIASQAIKGGGRGKAEAAGAKR